jgi:tRNA pseudouridine55 synthase
MILTNKNLSEINQWMEEVHSIGAAIMIDKPKGWTSFDVVAKLRKAVGIKKIGHAGTLDPLATGLLILCLGKATKQISDFQDQYKKYIAKVRLGATTKSYDSEFEEENIIDVSNLNLDLIKGTIDSFKGVIEQVPPQYSAIKVGGQPIYKLARKGKSVQLEPRKVEIYEIEIKSVDLPYVDISIRCSKGTYIRSLARDIGEKLGVGAYMKELRRTAIGDYSVEDSITVENVVNEMNKRNNID